MGRFDFAGFDGYGGIAADNRPGSDRTEHRGCGADNDTVTESHPRADKCPSGYPYMVAG